MKFIDMHCDILLKYCEPNDIKGDLYENPHMFDLKGCRAAGGIGQFFAIFFLAPTSPRLARIQPISDQEYFDRLYTVFKNTLKRHEELIAFAGNAKDMAHNEAMGKLSAFLTVEDGRLINGQLQKLKEFYDLGVRLITLTGNQRNCLGAPNSRDANIMAEGLTAFGKEAVHWMMDNGILVDVSHLSDGGFYDVLAISTKKGIPFVASHSNCRSLAAHPRNLTDEMIKEIGRTGGLIGVNFGPEFLNKDQENKHSSTDSIVAHMKRIKNLAGIESVALGSDFDGIHGSFDIPHVSHMSTLFQAMEENGFSLDEIEKIAWKNVSRIILQCMK